jgi:triosephosphate isomerase
MARKPFIAGNWKMNLNMSEALKLVATLQEKLKGLEEKHVAVAVCPPFVYLSKIAEHLLKTNPSGGPHIALGAQNMYFEKAGAFTGEVAGPMLSDVGCKYAIIGHSERRTWFAENDALIGKKVAAAYTFGLLPILCLGETLAQREQNQTMSVVKSQLEADLALLTPAQVETVTIAYEPVWAIGTGKAATPAMAQEVHQMIRATLADKYGKNVSQVVRIQYGGSVTDKNAEEIMSQPDIDGALVGGASLNSDAFTIIIKAAAKKAAGEKK